MLVHCRGVFDDQPTVKLLLSSEACRTVRERVRDDVLSTGALDVSNGRSDPTCVVYVAFNPHIPRIEARGGKKYWQKTATSHVDKQAVPLPLSEQKAGPSADLGRWWIRVVFSQYANLGTFTLQRFAGVGTTPRRFIIHYQGGLSADRRFFAL